MLRASILLALLSVISLIGGCSKPVEVELPPKKELTSQEKSVEKVSNYLNDIINAKKGDTYFCSTNTTGDFYSPRSYKILNSEIDANNKNSRVKVLIESSNASGSPITKTWEFIVSSGNNVCIDRFIDISKPTEPTMTYEQEKLIKDLEKSLGR